MLNKVIIMGRLTADPELRQTPNNISMCRFTVAVDRNFQKGEERQADFISVTAWRQTAEFVSRYFTKGSMIVVEGGLRTGSYNDRKYPDVKHYTTDVQADQVYFGESKKQSGDSGNSYQNHYGDYESHAPQPSRQEPAAREPRPQDNADASSLSIGNLSEFEEILSDGDLPF